MDHYEVLGISRDATQEDIKRAYRNLARRHHPDANPGDPAAVERFKEVGRAYEVLSDPGKRQRYDMFGDDGGRATVDFSDFGGVSDLFSSFFGSGVRSRSGPARGADIVAQVELTLEEAAWGIEREIEITTLRECSDCSGSGAAPGTFASHCPDCGGSGELRQVRRTFLGEVMTAAPCVRCGGSGEVITSPCPACGGRGRIEATEQVTLRIPAGVDDGAQLRVSGRGEAGPRGGRSGDLYVAIRITPHDVFRRAGDDLGCEVAIPMTVAALGGEVEVPTLDGPEVIAVAPGTQAGEIKRLRGKGMPRLDGRGRGTLIALLQVATPTDLDDEQAELLARLARLRDEPVSQRGLFGRIKEAFK
ncbi:MAG TPA: molecular chaperone DnaJ [Actinomycetota bacterium]|nr:molecular chaperone DnaJ [Actinomycetota bacterium]